MAGKAPGMIFEVMTCGFAEREMQVFERIFKLSAIRDRQYSMLEKAGGKPDLIILNDDAVGGKKCQGLLKGIDEGKVPVLRIGLDHERDKKEANYFAKPILALKLLGKMDALVTDAFDYAPELAISDNAVSSLGNISTNLHAPCADHGCGGKTLCAEEPILVVDDSESVRLLMAAQLAPCQFHVDYAETGEKALELVKENRYELVFLDVMLPGIDGFDVCKKIKKNLQPNVPVVLLTGKTSRLDKLRGTLSAADHYLTKPLQREQLIETLHYYFPKEQRKAVSL
jgi:twitching motility two-component system response regulator PilG